MAKAGNSGLVKYPGIAIDLSVAGNISTIGDQSVTKYLGIVSDLSISGNTYLVKTLASPEI